MLITLCITDLSLFSPLHPENRPEDATTLEGILQEGLRARALYDYQAGNGKMWLYVSLAWILFFLDE